MNIVIAGGSGFIGRALGAALQLDHHHITVLSRDPARTAVGLDPSTAVVAWDARNSGPWEEVIDGADAIVNLAGEPVSEGRWTAARRQAIRDSRLHATYALVHAIKRATRRPPVLVSASGVGYYGARDAMPVSESAPAGKGFLADLSLAWEHEARRAESEGVRVVLPRIGMVLGREGGALTKMVTPFKLFMGGTIAPGYQWVSWIHVKDLASLIGWSIVNERVRGPVNAVAPNAVTMSEFCRTLARVLHRPCWVTVPELALRLRFGELASMLTTGQRAEPRAATNNGFVFKYPALAMALHDVLDQPVTGVQGSRRVA